jgi:hypothetical protein
MYSDEDSDIDEDDVLSEMSTTEAEQNLASIFNGNLNDEKVFKLLNFMICKSYPIEKIEDVIWQLKKYYDDRARYYKNMYTDLMYHFDRIDNQELEP